MTAPEHPDEPPCPGILIEQLEVNPGNALIVVLADELGCPSCGRSSNRWEVPVFQDRMFHPQPGTRPDPGE